MDKKNHWPKILYTNFIKKRAYSKDKNKIREREKKEKKEIEKKKKEEKNANLDALEWQKKSKKELRRSDFLIAIEDT